jgi:hypothetical protein
VKNAIYSREVKISFDDEFPGGNRSSIDCVIGYLATWAHPSADSSERYAGTVNIFADHRGDITATYHNSAGETTYVIGGIRDSEGDYSFHS